MRRAPKEIYVEAEDYTDNLQWSRLTDLEPPITKALCPTDASLMALIDNWDAMNLPFVPVHTLPLKRGVKKVSGTKGLTTQEARHHHILLQNEFHRMEEEEKRKKKEAQIEV